MDNHYVQQCQDAFSPQGLLATKLDFYTPRAEQSQMALAIAKTITTKTDLVCEAGTGIGKTFAYLVPALLAQKKIVVATASKNLQDQLFFRDLPKILRVVGRPIKIALLKGRNNYLCHQRLKQFKHDRDFLIQDHLPKLQAIEQWALTSRDGDLSMCRLVEPNDSVWPLITSNSDNCLGQECEFFQQCCVLKARRQALAADVVVINQHLLCADLVLRDEGFGELLPGADVIIVDEAHHLPDIANQFFGERLSSWQIQEIIQDTLKEYQLQARDQQSLAQAVEQLSQAIIHLRQQLGTQSYRKPWRDILKDQALQSGFQRLLDNVTVLHQQLEKVAARSAIFHQLTQRVSQQKNLLQRFFDKVSEGIILWMENFQRTFHLHASPLTIATAFQQLKSSLNATWIFTSATLSVKHNFNHFQQQLGIEHAPTLLLNSPYPYAKQVLCYIPSNIPEPRSPHFLDYFIQHIKEVVNISRGRAFVLFTSHDSLQYVAKKLKLTISFPLFVQGQLPKAELLNEFIHSKNGVLLGTYSFWHGVDVRGDALSCVIIEKLPFASPGDPLLQAKLNALEAQGKQPFHEQQLPQAVIQFKQGFGRLIRDATDRGIFMIADVRIVTQWYGKAFLNSLPTIPRTRKIEDVKQFFQETTHEA
ncbi:MAG: ATP-dependent DNA helicase [Legionellales bacterium]|nr:ATP-dependent DNA helicase [Legionellales bacterium]